MSAGVNDHAVLSRDSIECESAQRVGVGASGPAQLGPLLPSTPALPCIREGQTALPCLREGEPSLLGEEVLALDNAQGCDEPWGDWEQQQQLQQQLRQERCESREQQQLQEEEARQPVQSRDDDASSSSREGRPMLEDSAGLTWLAASIGRGQPGEDSLGACVLDLMITLCCIYPNCATTANYTTNSNYHSVVIPHPQTFYCGRKREKWAFCFNPGALTLGITSTQRVERMNAVLKHLISRYSSLSRLDAALETVEAKLHLESERGNNDKVLMKHPTWSSGVLGTMLKFFEPIGQALKQLGASNYALDVTKSEAVAAMTYATERLAQGSDAVTTLLPTLSRGEGGVRFATAPDSRDLPNIDDDGGDDATMYARTSLPAFCALLHGQDITEVYKISFRSGGADGRAHLVVTGPGGFYLCSCLHLLHTGRFCRHFLAVLADFFAKGGWEFDPACLHPRWREDERPWSMASIARKTIREEPCTEGADDAAAGIVAERERVTKIKAAASNVIHADWVALGKEWGQQASSSGLSIPGNERLMRQMKAIFDLTLKSELESAKTAGGTTTITFSGTRRQAVDPSSPAGSGAVDGGGAAVAGRGRGGRSTGRGRGRGGRVAAEGGGRGRGRGRGRGQGQASGVDDRVVEGGHRTCEAAGEGAAGEVRADHLTAAGGGGLLSSPCADVERRSQTRSLPLQQSVGVERRNGEQPSGGGPGRTDVTGGTSSNASVATLFRAGAIRGLMGGL
ncbi:unnamed protein product [Ectocarpus sp. CCAP 1310/34]|nr:unnamed protein product [Ectocarpus sp. CCAP 1310/34]